VDFLKASGTPRCFSFPSQSANPSQISRKACRPSQLAEEQQLKPLAWYSALWSRTAFSNSALGNSCKNWEKKTFARSDLLELICSSQIQFNPIGGPVVSHRLAEPDRV
jgi:hypothetical protein